MLAQLELLCASPVNSGPFPNAVARCALCSGCHCSCYCGSEKLGLLLLLLLLETRTHQQRKAV